MKKWYESKTMWLGIATVLVSVTSGLTALLPMLAPVLTKTVLVWIMFFVGLTNVVLRSVTTKGIE